MESISGDGYFEFGTGSTTQNVMGGFNDVDTTPDFADLDFGIYQAANARIPSRRRRKIRLRRSLSEPERHPNPHASRLSSASAASRSRAPRLCHRRLRPRRHADPRHPRG